MKRTGQGKKDFFVRRNGKVSQLMTINRAVKVVLSFEAIGVKAEILSLKDFV